MTAQPIRLGRMRDALRAACMAVGVDPADARLLRQHAHSVFAVESAGIVVRLAHNPAAGHRTRNTVDLVRWLAGHGLPVTRTIDVDQPFTASGYTATYWQYYPQPEGPPPPAEALGTILRGLHEAGAPPVDLCRYEPLRSLETAIDGAASWMPAEDRTWLRRRRIELLDQYAALSFPLGSGLIHGDAYPGNLLWGSDGEVLLGDWDEAGSGPYELDLTPTHQGARFGRPRSVRQAFNFAYGYDVTTWHGFETLREMRDLHTLGSFIHQAQVAPRAARELATRVRSLREGDTSARWKAR